MFDEKFAGIIRGTVWRHVNGYEYTIVGLAIQNDGNIDRPVVVHQGNHDGRLWVRGAHNFLGKHASGVPRFSLVSK